MDEVRWKQDLEDDCAKLTGLLLEARKVEADRDAKLRRLRAIIAEKCQNPINDGNRKIIVFTAFTDTANYLYEHIADWAKDTLGIYAAQITGSGTNKTTMPGMGSNFDSLLVAFSPTSKERSKIDEDATDQIDLLIATDCISEGQNLQDCDYLINYDIHWNPVRIIQRFGRIDRLGSQNKVIQLVNFWPNMELDEYINLEARVSGRMGAFGYLRYRRRERHRARQRGQDERSGVFAVSSSSSFRIPSLIWKIFSGGVSITDLTLNDFRMDLSAFMKEHLGALEQSPHRAICGHNN